MVKKVRPCKQNVVMAVVIFPRLPDVVFGRARELFG